MSTSPPPPPPPPPPTPQQSALHRTFSLVAMGTPPLPPDSGSALRVASTSSFHPGSLQKGVGSHGQLRSPFITAIDIHARRLDMDLILRLSSIANEAKALPLMRILLGNFRDFLISVYGPFLHRLMELSLEPTRDDDKVAAISSFVRAAGETGATLTPAQILRRQTEAQIKKGGISLLAILEDVIEKGDMQLLFLWVVMLIWVSKSCWPGYFAWILQQITPGSAEAFETEWLPFAWNRLLDFMQPKGLTHGAIALELALRWLQLSRIARATEMQETPPTGPAHASPSSSPPPPPPAPPKTITALIHHAIVCMLYASRAALCRQIAATRKRKPQQ